MSKKCVFIGTSWQNSPYSYQFRELGAEFARRGYRVVFFMDKRRTDVENHENNPAIYTWPSSRPTRLRDALFFYKAIKRYKPSCLIANYGSVNVMMLAGILCSVPLRVCWYHTVSAVSDMNDAVPKWMVSLLRMRKRLVYSAATHIIPVSQAADEDARRTYNIADRKLRVVHNAIELTECEPTKSVKKEKRILCVGGMNTWKGQDVLIRAVALMKETMPAAIVEFMGNGILQTRYQNLAEELGVGSNCIFHGYVENDDILLHMVSAAVTVVPSRADTMPFVAIESLACGTPVIASAIGGLKELITDGVNGYLVPSDDPQALADRLIRILTDDEALINMRRNTRERFPEQFDLKKSIPRQVDWFEETMNNL